MTKFATGIHPTSADARRWSGLRCASVLVASGTMMLAACGAPKGAGETKDGTVTREPTPTYVEAHDLKQLMATVVDPQAQVFWHSAGAVTDDKGQKDLTPTTEEGWLATRSAAATVTEMGNLLMTPLYAKGRGEDWMQFSAAMVQAGQKAEKAAIDRNSDAIFETGGTLYEVCSACHQAYPPPVPANPAPAAAKAAG